MYRILTYPDKGLTGKSEKVSRFDSHLSRLSVALNRILKQFNGIGIAAPQVGVSMRLCLIANPEGSGPGLVLVNPVVLDSEGEEVSREGCLSIPKVFANVSRPQKVRVEACDLAGKQTVHEFEGEPARAAMHEIDHLDGTLFWDRLENSERSKLLKTYMAAVCNRTRLQQS